MSTEELAKLFRTWTIDQPLELLPVPATLTKEQELETKQLIIEKYGLNSDSYDIDDDNKELFLVRASKCDWVADGKYMHRDQVYYYLPLNVYFSLSESRSGSHFTDWYYSEPEIYITQLEVRTVKQLIW
ncbi:ribonucleotide reductase [Pseudomonas phage PspYZU05]|uniref:Uncharacterized protein n=1 Tax=Pseudomonas phage PspYZU05 TaxID=1983556 RepID=A0A2U7N2Q7_9CAUD|nr:ribonucleotide reductase [Pseudomonas phage PspYZU05]ASD52125.1 hypothetical protein PspYZU05_173 [Pseudomonas phage PspYZU05]